MYRRRPETIKPGYHVLSIEGAFVGKVTAIEDLGFLVAGADRDRWLAQDSVNTVVDRRVTLLCDRDCVDEYLYVPRFEATPQWRRETLAALLAAPEE